jgi:PBP1b-binding outer membrane lipoprotein LpoB
MKRLILLAAIAAALAGCNKAADKAADSAAAPQAQQTTEPSADVPAGALPATRDTGTPPKKP